MLELSPPFNILLVQGIQIPVVDPSVSQGATSGGRVVGTRLSPLFTWRPLHRMLWTCRKSRVCESPSAGCTMVMPSTQASDPRIHHKYWTHDMGTRPTMVVTTTSLEIRFIHSAILPQSLTIPIPSLGLPVSHSQVPRYPQH